ncbi:MAG: site-specific integrase [Gammaproteobacteria bacterium]|nr:site-specific integrase [Gammaproteobacteria bacterium]
MPSIRFRNSKYQVLVRMNGISISKTFTKKSDAQKWAKCAEVAIESGRYKRELTLTVKEALATYKDKRISHDKRSHPHVNNAIKGLGSIRVDLLNSHHLVRYRNMRLDTHSLQTVKHELSMVLRALKWMRDEEGYEQIKIPTVKMPKLPRGRDRRLSTDELNGLLIALKSTPQVQFIIELAIETGMRRSEIINLDWSHVNLNSKTLLIPKTKTNIPRTIPLTSKALLILSMLPRSITGQVFNIKADSVSHAFRRACKRIGIDDLRFHDLRHEAISRFFEMGLNVMEVASISGHKDLKMLQRYTHLRAEDLAKKLG